MDLHDHRSGGANGRIGVFHHRRFDPCGGRRRGQALVTPSGFGGQAGAFLGAQEVPSIKNFVNTNHAPVLTPLALMGSTDEDTPIAINLAGTFVNHGSDTTTIADADPGAILGGIALTATAGRGAWSYSLDGANYPPVGTVSAASALLLPATAKLRYAPTR